MQMLRQARYGGRVVPVNPKAGTIFGYEAVTAIGARRAHAATAQHDGHAAG